MQRLSSAPDWQHGVAVEPETTRIAPVVYSLQERLSLVEARVAHIDASLAAIGPDIRRIRETLEKQRGFVAGFTGAFIMLWSVLVALVWQLWGLRHA